MLKLLSSLMTLMNLKMVCYESIIALFLHFAICFSIPAPILVGYDPVRYATTEEEGRLFLTIAVGNIGGAPRSFSLVVSTRNGTAHSGLDYVPANLSIDFNAGETLRTHSIRIIPDNICENIEMFFSVIDSASGELITITTPRAVIAINDANELECGMQHKASLCSYI